jgi:hypothetical protein
MKVLGVLLIRGIYIFDEGNDRDLFPEGNNTNGRG